MRYIIFNGRLVGVDQWVDCLVAWLLGCLVVWSAAATLAVGSVVAVVGGAGSFVAVVTVGSVIAVLTVLAVLAVLAVVGRWPLVVDNSEGCSS